MSIAGSRPGTSPRPSRQHHDSLAVALELKPIELRALSRSSRASRTYPSELDDDIAAGTELRDINLGNEAPASPKPEHLTGLRLAIVSITLTVVMLLTMLDASIVATAIPVITNEFHSLDDIGWYASIFQLASAAFQPLTGKMYSKFSNKWVFLFFFAVFEIGSAVCGMAQRSITFICGRAIAGMGASGLMNGALTIVANIVSVDRRASLTGLMMGMSQVGVVIGPLVGGALTSFSTWRWCFYMNLPIGAVVFVGLLFICIPELVEKKEPLKVFKNLHNELDLIGFAMFTPAMVMLLLALQYGGNDFAWDSPTITGLFAGSGVLGAIWLAWDWRCGDEALIPFSMMEKRVVWSSSLTQWCNMTVVFTAAYFLPIYFQGIKGATPAMSGVYVMPGIFSQLVFAVLSGFLVQNTGYVIPYSILAGIIAAVSNGLFSTFTVSTPIATWIGYQILNGAGRGTAMQMPLLAVQAVLNPVDLPVAMGILIFFGMLGTAVMLAIANTIFNQSLQVELARHLHPSLVHAVLRAGATGFRKIVTGVELRFVLESYASSTSRVFYLAAGVGAVSVFISAFMGWTDVRKKM